LIQRGTTLVVADNSGAKRLKCIGIPGKSNAKYASLADIITCAVKGATTASAVKDHEIVKAVIVRIKKEVRRKDGSYIRFDDNAAVVIDKDRNPRGSRIFGSVARELKDTGYIKIASLAPEVW